MKNSSINSLVSHMTAHWRSMSEEPKLGKMILVKMVNQYELTNIASQNYMKFRSYNCIPNDLTKYCVSIGFLEKDKNDPINKIFVMNDYMYPSNYELGNSSFQTYVNNDKKAPFSSIFFEGWIYLEEIINL